MADLTSYEVAVLGFIASGLVFGLFGLFLVLRSQPPKR